MTARSAGATLPPVALYVHFPWCVRKCPYCDFNSHARSGELPEDAYVAALLADLDAELLDPATRDRPLVSLFLGGGTPSLFSAEAIGRFLDGVRSRIAIVPEIEVTLEANPGTVEQGRFAGYRAAGVNRLSIGVQSFAEEQLRALGRIHDGDAARRAIASARDAGFERVNVDLMHGLAGQTPTDAVRDLDIALAAGATHLSWYQLTIEPNTEFHRRPPRLPDDDMLGAIEDAGFARLTAAGFDRYEVSAWCRPGDAARHNLNYWSFGDYLAIGAGAHGKLTHCASDGLVIQRYRKTRMPEDYLASTRRIDDHRVGMDERVTEFMLNALRLREGVAEALFSERTGLPLDAIAAAVASTRARGLLRAGRLATTELGYRFLDDVVAAFATDAS